MSEHSTGRERLTVEVATVADAVKGDRFWNGREWDTLAADPRPAGLDGKLILLTPPSVTFAPDEPFLRVVQLPEAATERDAREWKAVGEQAGAARAGQTMWSGPHLKPGEHVTVVPKSELERVERARGPVRELPEPVGGPCGYSAYWGTCVRSANWSGPRPEPVGEPAQEPGEFGPGSAYDREGIAEPLPAPVREPVGDPGKIECWDDPDVDTEGAKGYNARYYKHVGCDEGESPWIVPQDGAGPPKRDTYECPRCCIVASLVWRVPVGEDVAREAGDEEVERLARVLQAIVEVRPYSVPVVGDTYETARQLAQIGLEGWDIIDGLPVPKSAALTQQEEPG